MQLCVLLTIKLCRYSKMRQHMHYQPIPLLGGCATFTEDDMPGIQWDP